MKLDHKKTFWSSIVAFVIGTSCCWLSSLAIWLGGATIIGSITTFVEDIQIALILIGTALGVTSVWLYWRKRKAQEQCR